MKRSIVVFLVCTLIISGILAGADINTEKFLFETIDGMVIVSIPAGSYEVKKTGYGDELYVEDFGCLFIPGKPSLPSKIFSIAIPPNSKFKEMRFEILNSETLPGTYNVPPVSLPRVIGREDSDVYKQELKNYEENYESTYGSNDPYPSSAVDFVQTSGYRKYNLVDVRFTPFTYYPLSGELVYHSKVKVYISYEFSEEVSTESVMVDNIARTEQQAKNIVFNYDQAQSWYTNNVDRGHALYDYVIITLDSLVSSVDSLADWEETKGRNVKVVTTSWISSQYTGYDLAEKIRNFLRDKYPSGAWGILDVCLVGGYDDVPMRRTAQNTGYGQPETDFYYAELTKPDNQSWDANGNHLYGEDSDPIDFYGEVNVGRIPWSDPAIVTHICEKSVAYEQNDDESFKKNILLLGAFFWPDTDNAVLMEYKTNPAYHPWMTSWTKTRMYEDAQSSYPCDYDLGYNNVRNVWSAGKFAFVNWAGHGSPTACYEYYPSQAFVDTATCNYLNDNYPSIIFADACSNSDTDEFNIGQAMLQRGGVGFLGSTKVAYGVHAWNNPNSGSSQSFDYYFTTRVTSGEYTQGQAHQWALTKMYTDNLWYYLKYETFEWGALWGNPDLTMGEVILSHPPLKPTKPTGPTTGVINENCTFSTSTVDPDGDQVYYKWDWGDGNTSEWLGPYNSGETTQASHKWLGLGSYIIKVKARDTLGATSDWSEHLIISIIDNSPPNAPTIDGPTSGKIGKKYDFYISATDPNNHSIYYFVSWGDSTDTGWLGPYNSGEEITLSHTWNKKGEYSISAKAKDVGEYTSTWTTHKIEIRTGLNVQLNELLFLKTIRNLN